MIGPENCNNCILILIDDGCGISSVCVSIVSLFQAIYDIASNPYKPGTTEYAVSPTKKPEVSLIYMCIQSSPGTRWVSD